jgi:hypothetical protein
MKIVQEVSLISCGDYAASAAWKKTRTSLYKAIRAVDWPPNSGKFTIYPESGKKRGEGNGVKPIKNGLLIELRRQGWTIEAKAKNHEGAMLGDFDALLKTSHLPVVLEWETGNISSSHRSLNKMAMLLSKKQIAAGILVVPSRDMYRFLTDRIGNISELDPYLDFWRSIPCDSGILEIAVIEHDATSMSVPRIPKGTDGRADG